LVYAYIFHTLSAQIGAASKCSINRGVMVLFAEKQDTNMRFSVFASFCGISAFHKDLQDFMVSSIYMFLTKF
jgi:hypothetical protein